MFREALAKVENATGELKAVLPKRLVQKLDWSTLQLRPGTFIDEQLSERQSDLLFSVQMAGTEAFIYVLVEHQSSSDALMPYRMLRYLVRVWDRYLEENRQAKRLPPIVPLVVHHGKNEWTAPKRFSELIDLKPELVSEIAGQVPDFEFVLDDLNAVEDEQILRRPMPPYAQLVLLSLKRARYSEDLGRYLRVWAGAIRQLVEAHEGVDALAVISYYILRVSKIPPDELRGLYAEVAGHRAEEAFMTGAEQLTKEVEQRALARGRAEGHAQGQAEGLVQGQAEGRVQGQQQGRSDVVLKLLALKFGPLSDQVTRRVQQATLDELDRFAERVLDATSIDDVTR